MASPTLSLRPLQRQLLAAGLALASSFATAVVTSLAWIAPANAQSMQALYEAARGYDATYLAARAQADSASYRLAQSKALLRPSVGLAGAATRAQTDPPLGPDRFSTTQQGALSAKQPLFNRNSSVTIDQAEQAYEISRLDLEIAEQDLIVRVVQAYLDVLSAQDALGTTQSAKKAFSEQLASAKRNFEVGTATITDAREAQSRFDIANAQEIAALNELNNKRMALDQLVGASNVAPLPLATPVVLPSPVPGEAEPWVTQAITGHPAVLKAQLALQVAKLEIDKARSGHLPTLDLVGSVGTSHATGNGTLLTGGPGTTNSANVGVQLNLPLFAGFAVDNRVKETVALQEQSRNILESTRRTVSLATRQSFNGVQSLLAQVKALEAAESSSQLSLEATQVGYKVGVRVNLDVLNAQTVLYTTQRDLAKARYDTLLTLLKLRQASGQLKPEDVANTSKLLAK